jgi:hypothetical protein
MVRFPTRRRLSSRHKFKWVGERSIYISKNLRMKTNVLVLSMLAALANLSVGAAEERNPVTVDERLTQTELAVTLKHYEKVLGMMLETELQMALGENKSKEREDMLRRHEALRRQAEELREKVKACDVLLQRYRETAATSSNAANDAKICQSILRTLDGAKQTFALEHRKGKAVLVTDADLFGTNSYIREKPKCPGGGEYFLRAVAEQPSCSIEGHKL